jgi:4-hydroxy-tetrahydrodipicolinate synthase
VSSEAEFGQVITAMVTPFTSDGELDLVTAQQLARWLTEDGRNDGLVVNGTTGESATTSDAEKTELVASVVEAVGDRARIIAGVGSADTRHSIALARKAEAAGAHALLVVAPYYSRPSQQGILAHFQAIADSTALPVMLYDIPKRTGVAIDGATLVQAGEHERIRAVKDAKGDIEATSWVMCRSPLLYYSGDDILNLSLLAVGAVGFVSVAGHVVSEQLREMLVAYRGGAVEAAMLIHRRLVPVYQGLFRAPAAALVKASLEALGLDVGPVRAPLMNATGGERAVLAADLRAAGIRVPETAGSVGR